MPVQPFFLKDTLLGILQLFVLFQGYFLFWFLFRDHAYNSISLQRYGNSDLKFTLGFIAGRGLLQAPFRFSDTVNHQNSIPYLIKNQLQDLRSPKIVACFL